MPIQYHQITFTCPKKVANALDNFLSETEAVSVTLMDAADEPIFEPGLNETPLWSDVKVVALFHTEEALQETLDLLTQLSGKLPPHEIEIIEERDWITEIQNQFQPQCFKNKLWVYPEWHQIPEAHQPALKLSPGLAFGTGSHPTTQMCLEALAEFVTPGMTILDYGCGSGILGLATLVLGAKQTYFVDIDPQALDATTRNAASNGFHNLSITLPEDLPSLKADILVANILAGPLMELKTVFEPHLKANGKIILAGILASQADALIAHYAPWKKLTIFNQQEEWVCLAS